MRKVGVPTEAGNSAACAGELATITGAVAKRDTPAVASQEAGFTVLRLLRIELMVMTSQMILAAARRDNYTHKMCGKRANVCPATFAKHYARNLAGRLYKNQPNPALFNN
jgi:hypothetical protein